MICLMDVARYNGSMCCHEQHRVGNCQMKNHEKISNASSIGLPYWGSRIVSALRLFRTKRFWFRMLVAFFCLGIIIPAGGYGIALWYQHTQKGKPYQLGVTFIPSYASYLGVDPKETTSDPPNMSKKSLVPAATVLVLLPPSIL